MSKKLVAYFSAGGVTARAAKALAQAAEADLFEIRPAVPYTRADLNWMDKNSRSTVEMNDRSSRPEISGKIDGMDAYDVVFLGFPVWWYREPSIIDTFLEQYDFSGKTIVLFATSGGSGLGKTAEGLESLLPADTKIAGGRMLNGSLSQSSLKAWVDGLSL